MSLRAFVLPAILVLFAACGDGDKPSSQPTPPQAPAAPANLIAVAGDGEVSLAWAPAAGAKSYNVYSGTASGVQPSATPAVTTTTPNTTVTGLANDTEYFFVVTALNDVGEGRPSAEVSATPATGALGVPSGLIANPGDGQVGLSWNAVAGAESYAIFWATGAGVTQASASVSPVTGTTYAHTALTNDTTHYYRVAAVAGGATGALSSEVSATPTAGLLAAPANVSAAAGIGEVVVSWNPVPDATGYNLYWDTTGPVTTAANQVAGATSPATVAGLTPGVEHWFAVAAVGSGGEGQLSASVSATPAAALVAPNSLVAVATFKQVELTWEPVAGATSYNVYISPTSPIDLDAATKVSWSGSQPFVREGLARDVPYYFTVSAQQDSEEGPAAAEVTATLAGTHALDPDGVKPLYANNGGSWGSYVANDGPDVFSASDTPCDAAAGSSYASCIHGGEKLVLEVGTEADCSDVTDLSGGLLEWTCRDMPWGVQLLSVGWNHRFALSGAIDFDAGAWKPETVDVLLAGQFLQSDPAAWWPNPIVKNETSTDPLVLSGGSLYIYDTNPNRAKITVGSGTTLVTQGFTLTGTGSGSNTGTMIDTTGDGGFTWIEVEQADATGYAWGVQLATGSYHVLRHTRINASGSAQAIHLNPRVRNCLFERLRLLGGSEQTIGVQASQTGNLFYDIVAAGGQSLVGFGWPNNYFDQITVSNTTASAVFVHGEQSGSVFSRLLATGLGGAGANVRALIASANAIHLEGATVAQSPGGVTLDAGHHDRLADLAILNVGGICYNMHGSELNGGLTDAVVDNLAVGHCGAIGITENASLNTDHEYHGALMCDAATTHCEAPGLQLNVDTQYGLRADVDVEGIAQGACVSDGPDPQPTIVADADYSTAFVGVAASDGLVSYLGHTVSGQDPDQLSTVNDWTWFDNVYRTWTHDAAGPLDPAARNNCRDSAVSSCEVVDWRVADGGVLHDVNALPLSGDDDAGVHVWSAADQSECDAIDGATWNAADSLCESIYLKHASEALRDGIGNDNVLCESNETCLFHPNLGAYQGEGALSVVPNGVADGALISGVTLLQYATTGVP